MEEYFNLIEQWIEVAGLAIDILGVLIIVGGLGWAIFRFWKHQRARPGIEQYDLFKTRVGHTLLLGLEILVAADIVRTVALEPSFTSVGVLGLLVLIRTFLSWTLILEIEERWPWQRRHRKEESEQGE